MLHFAVGTNRTSAATFIAFQGAEGFSLRVLFDMLDGLEEQTRDLMHSGAPPCGVPPVP